MIAVLISDITNPFYFEIIRGAQAAAAEAGYTMLLADAQESDVLEREALDRAIPTVEGIVLASSRMSDSAIRMTAKQRPMIVLNRAVADVLSLITDNPHGARRAAEHFAGLGHRTITYVAGPEASWADGVRWRSLRDAAADLGLQTRRIGPYRPSVAGGEQAATDFVRKPSSAILAYNDQLAIGIIRGLTATGTVVPDDVSIIGFDNIFAADLVTPRLTTIAAPLHALGGTAVHNLLAIINGARSRAAEPMVLPTKLVERASTARRRRGRPLSRPAASSAVVAPAGTR
jgi:LacI family transcriptional regulator